MNKNEKNMLDELLNKKKLIIKYKDKTVLLNRYILKRQNKDNEESINKIKDLHLRKLKIFDKMEQTDDVIKLHQFAKELEQIEFDLQKEWGFEQDRDFHRWWLVPKCTCPDMDNEEMYGMPYGMVDENCPVHGKSHRVDLILDNKFGYELKEFDNREFRVEFSFKKFIKDLIKKVI